MDAIRDLFGSILDIFSPISRAQLTAFQKKKILHEFDVFYDRNKDGILEWKDFELARKHICTLSGWKDGDVKYKRCQELFRELWSNLQVEGDKDTDGEITHEEWLKMWTAIYRAKLAHDKEKSKAKQKTEPPPENPTDVSEAEQKESYIPPWFEKYIEYKFNLYDRAGDGVIDMEEFEYTLSDGFNMPSKDCRNAFTMFSEGGVKRIDMAYFRQLALMYYLSNDPGAVGNFINGKLAYE